MKLTITFIQNKLQLFYSKNIFEKVIYFLLKLQFKILSLLTTKRHFTKEVFPSKSDFNH